ncbi:MAG TPA: hypothetical protein VKS43_01480 [Burkholderiales bacterium]|nr:hypothetical protein [Burkholderiales bacterium]
MADSRQDSGRATTHGALDGKAEAAALLALGAVVALTCASAIGAIATLIVISLDRPASDRPMILASGVTTVVGPFKARTVNRPMQAPLNGDCVVVASKAGMTYCPRNKFSEANEPPRNGPSGMIQARAEKSGR